VRAALFILIGLLSGCMTSRTMPVEPSDTSASQPVPAVDVYRYALSRAVKQVSEDEYADAYPALIAVIRSPVFVQLESWERHLGLYVAGVVAVELGQAAEGQPLLVRACAMQEADGDDWLQRFIADHIVDKQEDAVLSLTQLARRWPEKLQELEWTVVSQSVRQAHHVPAGEPALYGLLDSLYAAKWKVKHGIEPSSMWRDLAALELDRQQLARAREIVSRVQSPQVVISMRVDRRFDRLREAAPQYFDVDAAVTNELATMRELVLRSPRSLYAVVQLTYSMLYTGLYEDTLRTADEVIRRVEGAPAQEPPYDDMDQLNWIQDNRARALAALQRWGEAEVAVRAAAERKEEGHRNVSNVINLAWFYARAGRSDEALAALLDVGQEMSPYGRMQMHAVRYTAAMQKGDVQIAKESFEYLDKHRNEALGTWQWTLVRANRLDEAAALLIDRLRDPLLRGDALDELQDYADPPRQSLATEWQARWVQIRNRTDVRNAIEAVGRVETFRIPHGRG
jgi:beta-barrel assembly-enhancing protease